MILTMGNPSYYVIMASGYTIKYSTSYCLRLEAVVLITIQMPIQSAFQTFVSSNKRKLLYNIIQTMFDQALFLNTNAFF